MKRFASSLAAICVATIAAAEMTAPEDVSFSDYGEVATSLSGQPGDPDAGKVIMTTRGKGNCIACHQVTDLDDFPFHGEVGPSLDGAADRWDATQLRGIVANAKMTFPETVMPAFYKTSGFLRPGDNYTGKAGQEPLAPLLTAQEIEDVVAYLQTLKYED